MLGCPYCFGAADSTQVQAAKIGVLVLLAFIVPLLVAIGFIARTWAKRARELASDQPQRSPSTQSSFFQTENSVPSAYSAVDLKT